MKKNLVLMAMAGVALASCVSDEVADMNQQEQKQVKIAFDKPVMYDNSVGSRADYHGMIGDVANTANKAYPIEEDFQIYAVKHDGTFTGWSNATEAAFNDKSISYDNSLDGWVPKSNNPDPYYYWPSGMLMSFAACSPADLQQADGWNGRTYGDNGLTLTDFVVPNAAEEQFDLMFSGREVNKTKDDMNHDAQWYSGIPLTFHHALSAIRFSLKNDADVKVVLKRISLYGVAEKGSFTENITYPAGSNYDKYVMDGDDANVKPRWDVSTDPTTITSANPYVAFDGNLEFPEEAQYISYMLQNDQANGSENHILLLLPQTLTEEAYLKVDYEVQGTNTTLAHKTVKLANALRWDTKNNKVTTDKLGIWEIGTMYTYRLYYSADAAKKDKIFFSPRVDDWKDAGVAVIDLAGE